MTCVGIVCSVAYFDGLRHGKAAGLVIFYGGLSVAGDWIKVEHTLADKPEVWKIAESLGLEPDLVLGKLIRLWVWADQQTVTGNADRVTWALVNSVAGHPEFAQAMRDAGWLSLGFDSTLTLPNFDRHNGSTAKARAQTANRVKKHRDAATVTFKPPTVGDVATYCTGRKNGIDAESFVAHYEANGWLRGKNKVKDWKACVRTWERARKQDTDNDAGAVFELVRKHYDPDIHETTELGKHLTKQQRLACYAAGLRRIAYARPDDKELANLYLAELARCSQ